MKKYLKYLLFIIAGLFIPTNFVGAINYVAPYQISTSGSSNNQVLTNVNGLTSWANSQGGGSFTTTTINGLSTSNYTFVGAGGLTITTSSPGTVTFTQTASGGSATTTISAGGITVQGPNFTIATSTNGNDWTVTASGQTFTFNFPTSIYALLNKAVLSGTGTSTQVAYYNATNTLTSSPGLTTDGTNLNVLGYIKMTSSTMPTPTTGDTIFLHAHSQNGIVQAHVHSIYTQNSCDDLVGDNCVTVKNNSGGNMTIGQAVYVNGGGAANLFLVGLAQANATTTALAVGLVATTSVANNGFFFAVQSGDLDNMNTSAWNIGDPLYLSPTTPGALTNVRPVYPNLIQRIGTVTRVSATVGEIDVDIAPAILGQETGTISPSFIIGGSNAVTTSSINTVAITSLNTTAPLSVSSSSGAGTIQFTGTIPYASTTGVQNTLIFPLTYASSTHVTINGTAGRITSVTSNGTTTLDLATTTTAGSCTNCNVTYDAYGRISSTTNGSAGGGSSPFTVSTTTFSSSGTVTTTYAYTGASTTLTVPFGVTSIRVTGIGGTAGDCSGTGGSGEVATGTIPVSPGSILYIAVGGGSATGCVSAAGGFNGGGQGGPGAGNTGTGGAGMTSIATAWPFTTSSAVFVAAGGGGDGRGGGGGGGGGAGYFGGGGGGNGGTPGNGGNGGYPNGANGSDGATGGTQTAGGVAIGTGGPTNGTPGVGGAGGGTLNTNGYAGAGGSGFFAPGSTATSSAVVPHVAGANGSLIISYTLGNSTTTNITGQTAHIVFDGGKPTVASCGTGSSNTGNDTVGTITTGTGTVNTCNMTFNAPFNNIPVCNATLSTATTSVGLNSVSTTSVMFGFSTSTPSRNLYYTCFDWLQH